MSTAEQQLESQFIAALQRLKYKYREGIRIRAMLQNFAPKEVG